MLVVDEYASALPMTNARPGSRVDVLRCFARLAAQAGLNAGDAQVRGRTRDAAAWEVTAAVLRNFVAYACARGLPVQDVLPGLEPTNGRWDLQRLFQELEEDSPPLFPPTVS